MILKSQIVKRCYKSSLRLFCIFHQSESELYRSLRHFLTNSGRHFTPTAGTALFPHQVNRTMQMFIQIEVFLYLGTGEYRRCYKLPVRILLFITFFERPQTLELPTIRLTVFYELIYDIHINMKNNGNPLIHISSMIC